MHTSGAARLCVCVCSVDDRAHQTLIEAFQRELFMRSCVNVA